MHGARIIIASLIALTACEHSVETLCQKSIPTFQREIEGAKSSLIAWVRTGEPQRAIASEEIKDAAMKIEMDPRDRSSWELWAEKRLALAQRYMDQASRDPNNKIAAKNLSNIADLLVEFHGYSEQGELHKMIKTLEAIEKTVLQ